VCADSINGSRTRGAGEFDVAQVRRTIYRLLPEIKADVLALPPIDGPGFDEGAKKAHA